MRVDVLYPYTKFEFRRPCHSENMAHDALMGLVTLTFDLETGLRVASKAWNLPANFGHARPLGSRIIRYVRDGRKKATLRPILPLPDGRGIINIRERLEPRTVKYDRMQGVDEGLIKLAVQEELNKKTQEEIAL